MKTLLCLGLIWLAGSVLAQELPLPPRAANAPDGDAIIQKISALDLIARDELIAKEFLAGNAPNFLRKLCAVNVTNVADGKTNIATFFAAPDYLAVGSDENYFLAPISPATAQRIADSIDCTLPTRKMVDAVYLAATVKLTPSPIPPSAAMTSVPVFAQHNATVRAQRMSRTNSFSLGALTAGHKKDVVISARLASATNKVAIYGWHQTNGVAIQPLYLGHVSQWVDYSQCVRLVSQMMLVNGEQKSVPEVLADPKLCDLISDEGMFTNARYPTKAMGTPSTSPARSLSAIQPPQPEFRAAFPAGFSSTTNFGELTREISLPDDVRIVINAPAQEKFSTNKPVLLVFYALPNGNTIEQTVGKQPQRSSNWHYNTQHIGAQTRWVRSVLTNKTVVVAYLEAGTRSWPAWRKEHADRFVPEIFDGVRAIFSAAQLEVVLASHSGGGSLIFGYLNAVTNLPSDVKRIAFLDSNYAYQSANHGEKLLRWLAASTENRLCVLAYQDYLGLLEGKAFVSEAGGTWARSYTMLHDLEKQFQISAVTNRGLEHFSSSNGQLEFLLKENPERKIFHTLQVERNGFIHALLAGTPSANQGYQYFGERVYTNWVQP